MNALTLSRLFVTDSSNRNLALRLLLAAVIAPHGAQKLLGWFGGYGYSGTMQYFTGTVHLPWVLGFTVIMAESLGAIALALGLFTRVSAALVAATMLGAIVTVHAENGWFMNWFGTLPAGKEGLEFFLPVLGLAVVLVVEGAGRASLDAYIGRRIARLEVPARVTPSRSGDEDSAIPVR